MARAKRKKANEFGEEIEVNDEEGFLDGENESAEADKTFAEQDGTPANKHAKKLAKEESAKKKMAVPSGEFYTLKGGDKVVRTIVKADRVLQIYVGRLKKHRDGLEPLMAKWKKIGAWIEPHDVTKKIADIRAELAAKPAKKK